MRSEYLKVSIISSEIHMFFFILDGAVILSGVI